MIINRMDGSLVFFLKIFNQCAMIIIDHLRFMINPGGVVDTGLFWNDVSLLGTLCRLTNPAL